MIYHVDGDDNDTAAEGWREVSELVDSVRGYLILRAFRGELKQSAVDQGKGLPDVEGAN